MNKPDLEPNLEMSRREFLIFLFVLIMQISGCLPNNKITQTESEIELEEIYRQWGDLYNRLDIWGIDLDHYLDKYALGYSIETPETYFLARLKTPEDLKTFIAGLTFNNSKLDNKVIADLLDRIIKSSLPDNGTALEQEVTTPNQVYKFWLDHIAVVMPKLLLLIPEISFSEHSMTRNSRAEPDVLVLAPGEGIMEYLEILLHELWHYAQRSSVWHKLTPYFNKLDWLKFWAIQLQITLDAFEAIINSDSLSNDDFISANINIYSNLIRNIAKEQELTLENFMRALDLEGLSFREEGAIKTFIGIIFDSSTDLGEKEDVIKMARSYIFGLFTHALTDTTPSEYLPSIVYMQHLRLVYARLKFFSAGELIELPELEKLTVGELLNYINSVLLPKYKREET